MIFVYLAKKDMDYQTEFAYQQIQSAVNDKT